MAALEWGKLFWTRHKYMSLKCGLIKHPVYIPLQEQVNVFLLEVSFVLFSILYLY